MKIIIIASIDEGEKHLLHMILGKHSNVLSLGDIDCIFGKNDLSKVCSLCDGACHFWQRFNQEWKPNKNIFLQLSEFSTKEVLSISKVEQFRIYLQNKNIDIKAVRLVRDGRDYLYNVLREYPGYHAHKVVTEWKNRSIDIDLSLDAVAPEDRLTVHFEDLLNSPAATIKKICHFSEIEYEPSMLQYTTGEYHMIGVNKIFLKTAARLFEKHLYSGKNQKNIPVGYRQMNHKEWRKKHFAGKLIEFERFGGQLNRKYGYPPSDCFRSRKEKPENNLSSTSTFTMSYPKPSSFQDRISNTAVVIRSSGERTEYLCRKLIAEQVSEKNITVLRGVKPFREAVKQTFEIGIDFNLPWTIAADADLLVAPGGISEIIKTGEKSPDNAFEINFQMLDKFFCGPKPGGLHLYRTALLNKGLLQLPEEKYTMRPENFTIKRMNSIGYPMIQNNTVTTLHDYEQYYRDIYRKAYFHGKKHTKHFVKYLLQLWQHLAKYDQDFQVALWGFQASQSSDSTINADVSVFGEEIEVLLRIHGVVEKKETLSEDFNPMEIYHAISGFQPSAEFLQFNSSVLTPKKPLPRIKRWQNQFQRVLKQTGPVHLIPWLFRKLAEKFQVNF
ncbi:MAG: hypothetical protein C4522_20645 [Desulfobacteraceae bacterium]|nr:MAG: hypothetical protein C4522_20645 [Desulfobacteraceae bacterium]